jgi:hypothetical protein
MKGKRMKTGMTDRGLRRETAQVGVDLAAQIKEFSDSVYKECGGDCLGLWYCLQEAAKRIREEAVSIPGVRVTVLFAEDDGGAK